MADRVQTLTYVHASPQLEAVSSLGICVERAVTGGFFSLTFQGHPLL
jgi:hypothetical protein